MSSTRAIRCRDRGSNGARTGRGKYGNSIDKGDRNGANSSVLAGEILGFLHKRGAARMRQTLTAKGQEFYSSQKNARGLLEGQCSKRPTFPASCSFLEPPVRMEIYQAHKLECVYREVTDPAKGETKRPSPIQYNSALAQRISMMQGSEWQVECPVWHNSEASKSCITTLLMSHCRRHNYA